MDDAQQDPRAELWTAVFNLEADIGRLHGAACAASRLAEAVAQDGCRPGDMTATGLDYVAAETLGQSEKLLASFQQLHALARAALHPLPQQGGHE